MTDTGIITTTASIISGFGLAVLVFRIHRELEVANREEPNWIPWADRMLVAATLVSLVSLLFLLLPIVVLGSLSMAVRISGAAMSASIVLASGYIFAILAHYRFLWSGNRSGQRANPEPAERRVVILTVALAELFFVLGLFFS